MSNQDTLRKALAGLKRARARIAELESSAPVAIVGLGLRLPGGVTEARGFWNALTGGRDLVGPAPADRPVIGRGGWLADPWAFDHAAFHLSPREADAMDPQQKLLLEVASEALGEQRGKVGVFVGLGLVDHARDTLYRQDLSEITPWDGTGNFHSVASGRIAYALGLTGPALTVDTACSSGLVALHLAANAVRDGACSSAVAAAANLIFTPHATTMFEAMGALSPDGRCATFDAAANGYVRGEAVVALHLKRLDQAKADGDVIYGVLRGTALNQDGASNGLTAPNGVAQEAVIRAAHRAAGVKASDIGYVEAHGTGTPLGDPIEIESLRNAYGEGAPIALGAVKSVVGHTEAAAGLVGVLKTLLVLRHGVSPANLHFHTPNPRLELGERLKISAEPLPVAGLGAVSAFGMSGTNAHAILEAGDAFDWPVPRVWNHEPAIGWRVEPSSEPGGDDLAAVMAGSMDAAAGAASALGRVLAEERGQGTTRDPRLERVTFAAAPALTGTWLVTGATGPVGRAICAHLLGLGAQVVAMSRSGAAVDGCTARAGDVAERVDLTGIDGVVHAAGVLDDAPFDELTPERFAAVARPKVGGAEQLLKALGERPLIVISSASQLLGIPGQAAYALANAQMEELVAGRAAVVAWGPWAVGMAADLRWLGARGIRPLTPLAALRALDHALATGESVVGLDIDPVRFAETARRPGAGALFGVTLRAGGSPAEVVPQEVAKVLGRSDVPADVGLFELGLDSIMAAALVGALSHRLGRELPATLPFDAPTVDEMIAWLEGHADESVETVAAGTGPVAIVGLALRVPGADSPDALHSLLMRGEVPFRTVDRWDVEGRFGTGPGKTVVREAGLLEDIWGFDHAAFGMSPAEARAMDPQQRLLLELSATAVEPLGDLTGGFVGVFMGLGPSEYLQRLDPETDRHAGVGNHLSFAAGRIAYHLGLRGPALALDTACSSSLVAIHLAAQALASGDCKVALAGGAHLLVGPSTSVQIQQLGALSPTQRCHTFQASADGYARGEGGAVVVLKRLEDAQHDGDPIYGVIHGSSVNHDGRAAGLTVPSGVAQRKVLRAALQRAGISPTDVGFVETHGTGTRLGDPIEVSSIAEVYGGAGLALGAVKANLGHLEQAAGVVGLIRALWASRTGEIGPVPLTGPLNPDLGLAETHQVPDTPLAWEGRRVAAVSSFGLSGTNAHVLLEATAAPDWRGKSWNHTHLEVPLSEALPLWQREWVPVASSAGDAAPMDWRRSGRMIAPARSGLAGLVRTQLAEGAEASAVLGEVARVSDEPVIKVEGGVAFAPRLRAAEAQAGRVGGTILITGGRGPLGRAIARDLVAHGAASVLLLSRSAPSDAERADVADLPVTWLQGDVRELDPSWAFDAAVHAAGVLADAPLAQMDQATWDAPFGAKLGGAKALAARNLDWVVVVSSLAAWLGWPGQANYAAANRAMEAFAEQQGWGVIALGPVAAGMATPHVERMRAVGVAPLRLQDVGPAVRIATGGGTWLAAHLDRKRLAAARPDLAGLLGETVVVDAQDPTAEVMAAVAELLGVDVSELDTQAGFFEQGFDSIAATALADRLTERLGRAIPSTLAFDHPNIDAVVAWLTGKSAQERTAVRGSAIAIVGMGLRFSGASTPDEFWQLLVNGEDRVRPVPASRWPSSGTAGARHGSFLDDVRGADPLALRVSPKEAAAMDPQQRLLVEVSLEALERAGMAPDQQRGRRGAVFFGIGGSDYDRLTAGQDSPYLGTGNDSAFAAGRVAWLLGWEGAASSLNTACSSSLVATHLAVQALRDGSADVALAGAVRLMLSEQDTERLDAFGALSETGRCRTFDASADGYVRGEGAGAVVLKRLEDAERDGDPILAVIHGSAVNQDGASAGLTTPSGSAQARLMSDALADAGVDADQIAYVEAHGTGTRLGDPIEVHALGQVHARRDTPLLIGSVKTNLGHLELAAGMAGLLKSVLSLQYGQVPPSLHFESWNPAIDRAFAVDVVQQTTALTGHVGVSAFGLSGTNAHLVLGPGRATEETSGTGIALVSAPSRAALQTTIGRLAAGELSANMAFTLQIGRARHPWRAAGHGENWRAALNAMEEVRSPTSLLWMFTGQGSQWGGMSRGLRQFPVVRATLDAFDDAFGLVNGRTLLDVLDDDVALTDTAWTQRALVAYETAVARQLLAWGVEPTELVGHSIGEIAAVHIAEGLTFEETVALVAVRADAMAACRRDGAMMAVRSDKRNWPDGVKIAAINAPGAVVLSGDEAAVRAAGEPLDGVLLRVSHAFHSHHMADAAAAIRALDLPARDTRWPVLSTLRTGVVVRDAHYWADHVMEAVDFAAAIGQSQAERAVELGPAAVLSRLSERQGGPPADAIAADRQEDLLRVVGELFKAGHDFRAEPIVPGALTSLPTTAFHRQEAWLGADVQARRPDTYALADGRELPGRAPSATWDGRGDAPAGDVWLALDGSLSEQLVRLAAAAGAISGPFWVAAPDTLDGHALLGAARSLALERPGVRRVLHRSGEPQIADVPEAVLDGQLSERVLVRTEPSKSEPALTGRWLVTGGTGALGRRVVDFLADAGAEVVAASRSGGESWRERVSVVACDVTGDLAPLGGDYAGIVHLAGVLDDAPLARLDAERIDAVLAPKLAAARLAALGDRFVAFSSATAVMGAPGQAAYGAANAWLDAFVAQRGRGVSIGWGPWAGGGMAAELEDRFAREGVTPIAAEGALLRLGDLLQIDGSVLVANVDWERVSLSGRVSLDGLQQRALGSVASVLERVLGYGPGEVPADVGFFDLGLDSVLAVQAAEGLAQALDRDVPTAVLFDHPTLRKLQAWADGAEEVVSTVVASASPIAIVGAGLRFPGASSLREFSDLLREGRDLVRSGDRWALGGHLDRAGWLDDIRGFDPSAFGLSPREAAAMDPQQRLLLEVSLRALESANVPVDSLEDRAVGVFVGIGPSEYDVRFQGLGEIDGVPDAWSGTGNDPSFAAGRIAYVLGTRGPALALTTACSSSLVAVHMAAASLRAGECDLAIAGGVNLLVTPDGSVRLDALNALSPSARCAAFDASADGYVRGEGAGVVVLKRLDRAEADGDDVLAILRGSAVNHDGRSGGLTVPSGSAQRQVLRQAWVQAGEPEVAVVEAHGTGTSLGDPIEARALLDVYGAVPVGSVKSNIGHLELAAGIAGLLKLVVMGRDGFMAPSLHFTERNPQVPAELDVLSSVRPWTGSRVGAVSSFGLSGTNAHLILEMRPPTPQKADGPLVIPLSADSEAGLQGLAKSLRDADLGSAMAAQWHGRAQRRFRALVWGDSAEVRAALSALSRGRSHTNLMQADSDGVAFLFTGQGSQRHGMLLGLLEVPQVQRAFIRVRAALLDTMGRDIEPFLRDDPALHHTRWTQPALFALQVCLGLALAEAGVQPSVVLGHSIGEVAAAVIAGVMTVEDGARLVVERASRMGDLPEGGAMVAIGASPGAVAELLDDVELAVHNSAEQVVLAGDAIAVERAATAAEAQGLRVHRLRVSHAFHSARMEPMLAGFGDAIRGLSLRPAAVDFLSNLSAMVDNNAPSHKDYWVRQVRSTVRFAECAETLRKVGPAVTLELGPAPVLRGLTTVADGALLGAPEDGVAAWRLALGTAWLGGESVEPSAVVAKGGHAPDYVFDRRELWVDDRVPAPAVPSVAAKRASAWQVDWQASEPGAAPAHIWDVALSLKDDDLDGVAGTMAGLQRFLASDPRGGIGVLVRAEGLSQFAVRGLVRGVRAERPELGLRVLVGTSRKVDDWSYDEDEVVGGQSPRWVAARPHELPAAATVLVTGGTGPVGLAIADALAARGSRVVLASRSPVASAHEHVVLDVTDGDAIAALLAELRPDGIVHAAGVLDDGPFATRTPKGLKRCLAVKAGSFDAFDRASRDLDLSFFVGVGSVSGVLGANHQAPYAAANAALHAVADRRRRAGLAASVVDFGPWAVGMAAKLSGTMRSRGLPPMPPESAVAAFLAHGGADVVIADLDPGQLARQPEALARTSWLRELVHVDRRKESVAEMAAALLGLKPGELDPKRPLVWQGFDSVMAAELKRRIDATFGVDIPAAEVTAGPSVRELEAVIEEIGGEVVKTTAKAQPAPVATVTSESAASEEDDSGISPWVTHLLVAAAAAIATGLMLG